MSPVVNTCQTLLRDFRNLATAARPRSMREWAEAEIIIPSGPKVNLPYRVGHQPALGHWFEAIESGHYNRFAATGPSQSGKSLACFIIPALYYLFEMRETVIIGAPNGAILEGKWLLDLLPVIRRSRYADLLPRAGRGSQGGFSDLIVFGNGAAIKFMSGGASDAGNAAFTARVACLTEVDGMDEPSETSRESDPVNRIAARLRAYGSLSRMFLECTSTVPRGRITQELKAGTNSKIVAQCRHCDEFSTPEREQFVGWQDAGDELQAEAMARFSCPRCGGLWTPADRVLMNRNSKLVHKGQEIRSDGTIIGLAPGTRSFSFRYSGFNNLFADEAQLGREEFRARLEEDQENAQKARCQQAWAEPWVSQTEASDLTPETVASRLTGLPRCTVPADAETLVVQVDVHNRWLYWCAVATGPNSTHSVVDYGIHLCPNPDTNGTRQAVALALRQLRDELTAKDWKKPDGTPVKIDLAMVDSGFLSDLVVEFITEAGLPWRCSKGKGDYRRPDEGTPGTYAGDHWHFSEQPGCVESNGKKWWLVIPETNHWLHVVQSGFKSLSFSEDGTRRQKSIAIFGDDASVHTTSIDSTISRSSFGLQICAWRWGERETKRQGLQMGWVAAWGQDHWCDCLYGCLVADRIVRDIDPRFRPKQVEPKPVRQREPMTMPDGRAWLITDRMNEYNAMGTTAFPR